jgi:uncharacterized phiE125 gp8 family phage protein
VGIILVTAATSEPVVVADVSPGILDYSASVADAARLTSAIAHAVRWVEGMTQRQFMAATWKQTFDDWPDDGRFKIDLQPFTSVTHLKYYDADATLTTVDSGDYWTDTSAKPPIVQMKPDFDYPTVEQDRPSAIELTYVAGESSAANVPTLAKKAIILLATYYFRQAEANPVPDSADQAALTPNYQDIPQGVWSIVRMLSAGGYS